MRTLRGAVVGAIALLLTPTAMAGSAGAAVTAAPVAPYTAFTTHFENWGYIDGSFSYDPARSTPPLEVYQQTPNGYALMIRGFTTNHWHHINVTPPVGTRFTAGATYSTRTSFAPLANSTVLNVSGDGQGCDDNAAATGTLKVAQADYDDATGKFTAFAASYAIPCGGVAVAKGEIRFQSSLGYKATDSWDYQLQFQQQPVGAPGTPKDVLVEVNGSEPTTFGAASLSGADPAAFQITANTCSGKTLGNGTTCKVTVTPKATALRDQTAVLTLVEDSAAGAVKRLLSLTGFDARNATVSPPWFDFGTVPAYDVSAPQTVTLTGSGVSPITFGTAAITGPYASWFKLTDDGCSGRTLATGQTCSMTAVARPGGTNSNGAVLSLPDDSSAGSTDISLGVNGYASDRGTYYPMSPYRIMDSRIGLGVAKGVVGGGRTASLQVTGAGGVPTDASTVVLNVTVTGASGGSFLTVYPSGVARPTASSLNFGKGWTGANSVTVKVGEDGKVNLFNSDSPVHVIVDVYGYYSKGHAAYQGYMGGQYHPLPQPVRLSDTRTWGIGKVPAGFYINSVASWGSGVDSHVRAFAVNVTATETAAPGYLTAWNGYGGALPNTSTLNYEARVSVPNFAVVPAIPCNDCGTATGLPSIGVYTSTATHILVDIVGFYDDGTLPDGLRFTPEVPTRIADTRSGQGWPARLGPAATATIQAPASVRGPDTRALATNVTAVLPSQSTYLSVWPTGVARPGTSNLNPVAGTVVPNAVQTMLGTGNAFNVFNAVGSCDVIVDVVGTFFQYPPSPPSGWNIGGSSGRNATTVGSAPQFKRV